MRETSSVRESLLESIRVIRAKDPEMASLVETYHYEIKSNLIAGFSTAALGDNVELSKGGVSLGGKIIASAARLIPFFGDFVGTGIEIGADKWDSSGAHEKLKPFKLINPTGDPTIYSGISDEIADNMSLSVIEMLKNNQLQNFNKEGDVKGLASKHSESIYDILSKERNSKVGGLISESQRSEKIQGIATQCVNAISHPVIGLHTAALQQNNTSNQHAR